MAPTTTVPGTSLRYHENASTAFENTARYKLISGPRFYAGKAGKEQYYY